MKMLVVFEKSERLRHIGHLDLMRAMQRALRRSDLPLQYSQGFNPHILLTFAAPLSVGISGLREVMEVPLAREIPEDAFLEKLSPALPGDIRCLSARAVPDTHPAPMALLRAAKYDAVLENGEALLAAVPAFLAQKSIIATRKTKSGEKPCDIRPMIYDLSVSGDTLSMTLALCEEATCKPDLLLTALADFAGAQKPRARLRRLALLGRGFSAPFDPLEIL